MIKHGGIALSLLLAACASDGTDGTEGPEGPAGPIGLPGEDGGDGPAGPQLAMPALYTTTNAAAGNGVAAYLRATNGNLSRLGTFATGGTGGSPASQSALVFDRKSQRFFAVNNGNDTISMLDVDEDGKLAALATVAAGGKKPVSLAVHDGTVYVANRGDGANAGNISGFKIEGDSLAPIAGSTRPLSAATDVRPTDIAFTPDGKFVVVAELLTNKLDTFAITAGVAQPGSFQASAADKPFAFDFSPEGFLIVAEVGDGSATGSSVSSYSISEAGALTAKTSALKTQQGAACWIAAAGDHAYVSNTASGTLTALDVSATGTLTLRDASGVSATTAAGSADLVFSPDRGFLYVLANATGGKQIFVFEIRPNGNLVSVGALTNVSPTAAGLVAR